MRLCELIHRSYRYWLYVPTGKLIPVVDRSHAQVIGETPKKFGFTEADIIKFEMPTDPSELYDWSYAYDDVFGSLYRNMYDRQWIRIYGDFVGVHISGNLKDLRTAWSKGTIQEFFKKTPPSFIMVDWINGSQEKTIEFKLPTDRIYMTRWFRGEK